MKLSGVSPGCDGVSLLCVGGTTGAVADVATTLRYVSERCSGACPDVPFASGIVLAPVSTLLAGAMGAGAAAGAAAATVPGLRTASRGVPDLTQSRPINRVTPSSSRLAARNVRERKKVSWPGEAAVTWSSATRAESRATSPESGWSSRASSMAERADAPSYRSRRDETRIGCRRNSETAIRRCE